MCIKFQIRRLKNMYSNNSCTKLDIGKNCNKNLKTINTKNTKWVLNIRLNWDNCCAYVRIRQRPFIPLMT